MIIVRVSFCLPIRSDDDGDWRLLLLLLVNLLIVSATKTVTAAAAALAEIILSLPGSRDTKEIVALNTGHFSYV